MPSPLPCDATQTTTHAHEVLPLSARQSLLWLDDQLFPEARYHNLVQTVEIHGSLDAARLVNAFARVAASRDAMRMRVDSHKAQQSYSTATIPELSVITLEPSELDSFIARRCVRSLYHDGPMWDAALLRLGATHHVLYFCQDHIITDAISCANFLRDLEALYVGTPVVDSPSFRDYLQAEAQYRASEKAHKDQTYWDEKIAAGAPPLRPYGLMRTDKSTAVNETHGAVESDLARRLLELAGGEPFSSISPASSRLIVMATAISALLYRVTGNREIVLGTPVANRTQQFGRTMGLLMEQLFLRINIQDDDTLLSLARAVRKEVHASMRHSPACVSDRGIEYVTLNMIPRQPREFAGMPAKCRLVPAPVLAQEYDPEGDFRDSLGLQVADFADGNLEFRLNCHRGTFDQQSQDDLSRQLVRVLEAMVSDLGVSLDRIRMVDESDRRLLLDLAAGKRTDVQAVDLVEQFVAKSQLHPKRIAVEAPEGNFCYAELDAMTNRLARRLLSLGVGCESRVGIAMPRGIGELVSLLATLKAGGAYVPIDPTHPVDRVRVILEDAAPQVLVAPSNSPLVRDLPTGVTWLPLDDLAEAIRDFGADAFESRATSTQLAYILFTSGSTGRPKGVEVGRAAFANFLNSMARTPGFSESERLLAVTTTTFDIAGLELFLPLYVGGTVIVADRETATDPRRLRERLESDSVNVMQATPATWRLLLDAGYQPSETLRMFVGGEALSQELAKQLTQRGGELWNLYGPTETTVWSSVDRVRHNDARVTIGRPIDRTQIYVLDPELQLVPPRVIGEIFIGGDGLARGYRGRPDLTAERFLMDPFRESGSRLYRTGDLGRVLYDGRIECLGRADSQVKIRGFRIELGEIESVLRSVTGVTEAVVTVATQNESQILVAYWVGNADRQDMYAAAHKKLPQYMVPSAYQQLSSFPLTTSGKIDRKRLPPVEVVASAATSSRVPESDAEKRIARIFCDILRVSSLGVDQDFFELGGTSVLVINARTKFEEEFGTELPLRTFFANPTISALAAHIESSSNVDVAHGCLVRLKPGNGERSLFLIHDADGEIVLYRNLAQKMPSDVAVYGVVPLPSKHLPIAQLTIKEMAAHYLKEIREQQPKGPYHLGGLCAGGVIAFEVARQLVERGERIGQLALIEAVAPNAKMRPQHVIRRRLQRSMSLLRELPRLGTAQVLHETRRRVSNFASYVLTTSARKFYSASVLAVLGGNRAGLLANGGWRPSLSTREVYLQAASRYIPKPVRGVPAVLVRATEGTESEPASIALCVDPDFGWSEVLGTTLRIVDSGGTHSSLLHQATVADVAAQLLSGFARNVTTSKDTQ